MFKIGLDLGYGYVKGVNENNQRIVFPSLVGDAYQRNLAGIFGTGSNQQVENMHITINDGTLENEYFVGELARREGQNISFALNEDKMNHPNTKALLAASALLLVPDEDVPIHLVTGLPLEQYAHKKEEFKEMLNKYHISACFAGNQKKDLRFDKVTIFPQAAGAVFSAIWDDLPKYLFKGSYLGLIDIGFKTVDVIVFLVEDNLVLREDLSLTLDFGMSNLNNAADKIFTQRTGNKLDLPELIRLVSDGGIFFRGKQWDFSKELYMAKKELARVIKDRITATWGTKLDFFNTIFLAGGGAKELFEFLKDINENAVLVKDARFANANGFLKVAEMNEKTQVA